MNAQTSTCTTVAFKPLDAKRGCVLGMNEADDSLRHALLRLATAQRDYADAYGAWKQDDAMRARMDEADRAVEAAWREILHARR